MVSSSNNTIVRVMAEVKVMVAVMVEEVLKEVSNTRGSTEP